MLLQQLVGLNWNLVDAHTPAATNEAGTFHAAGQVTFVLRDTANYKLKSILVDGNFSGLSHYGSRTGLAGGFLDWVKAFSHDHVGPDDPYMWLVSLGERYIRDTDANFAGFTVATNRKIRRRRGLA
jgi:hypothetical protein